MDALSLDTLKLVYKKLAVRHIKYKLGAKAPSLTADTADYRFLDGIDCSGFVRYAIAKASNQRVIIPDGSFNQLAWAQSQGLHKLGKYRDVVYGDPSRLFLCFIKASDMAEGIGHVWLVHKNSEQDIPRTMESYGGVGVGSRPWFASPLRHRCHYAFELPTD
jgi:hypothetical protein